MSDSSAHDTVIDSISQRTIKFNEEDELRYPVSELSTIQGNFPWGHLHILVRFLQLQVSRSARDVAEIMLSLTTPCIVPPRLFLAHRLSLPLIDIDAVHVLRGPPARPPYHPILNTFRQRLPCIVPSPLGSVSCTDYGPTPEKVNLFLDELRPRSLLTL